MNVTTTTYLAKQKLQEHGLTQQGWTFQLDHSVRRFGVCRYRTKVISMSMKLITLNDETQVLDVILHEIAHALVGYSHGHNNVWKRKCIEIGAKPERCYTYDNVVVPRMRYQATCGGCGIVYQKARMSARRKYNRSACKCQANYSWDKKIILEYIDTAN